MSKPKKEEMLDKLNTAFEITEDPDLSFKDTVESFKRVHQAIYLLIEKFFEWQKRARKSLEADDWDWIELLEEIRDFGKEKK